MNLFNSGISDVSLLADAQNSDASAVQTGPDRTEHSSKDVSGPLGEALDQMSAIFFNIGSNCCISRLIFVVIVVVVVVRSPIFLLLTV